MLGRFVALAAAAVWIVGPADARAAPAPLGVLSQLEGRSGCLYDPQGGSAQGLHVDLPGRCGTAAALDGAYDAVMSPDGRNVYVGSFSADSISIFARASATGRLRQLPDTEGCLVDDPYDSPCADASALNGVSALVVSPDGRNLYAASFLSNALVVFARDRTTGALRQLDGGAGCLVEGVSDYDCGEADALFGATSAAVSPDGRNVYVASALGSAVAVFARAASTGTLRQLGGTAGCVRDALLEVEIDVCAKAAGLEGAGSVAVSANGRNVYVASLGSASVAAFSRNPATGALTPLPGIRGCVSEDRAAGPCADGRGLEGAFGIALSPDGRNVYVATGFDRRIEQADAFAVSGVAVFARDLATGALRQLAGRAGCISENRREGGCADGRALEGALAVKVSRDGRNAYVAASASNAIAIFARDPRSGALRQLAGKAGCVSETGTNGSCRDVAGLWGASAIALSPDGRHAYAPGFFSSAVVVFARSAPPRRGGR
ncbi:MAG: lactonase family protein [Gaiellaceae bacterium]